MPTFRPVLLLSLALLLHFTVLSQSGGSLRGFVYDKDTGEPAIFCNVFLLGTTIGMATDVNGYYNLTRLKEGQYTLVVSYLGYDTIRTQVELKANQIITKNLFLQKSSIQLEESVVSAERLEQRTEVRTSVIKITPKQIERIPTIGSEPDLAQYLQVLPGVIFTGDQGGQLYIRGGPPIQNLVLLDRMVVYNPFHSIGLFSVFDSDIIRNADVYTGGFGAEFGGRISSVMNISTRDGNKNRLAGKFSASTFGSKLLLEGPLKKSPPNQTGGTSFIISAKTSYLKESSKVLYRYIDEDGLPFNFTDIYGKVSLSSANGSKLNLFGFSFSDMVKYKAVSDLNWNSTGLGGNVVLVPGGSPVLIKANFSFSDYGITFQEQNRKPRVSDVSGFNLNLEFLYFLGGDEFSYGLEGQGFTTNFDFYNSIGRKIEQQENTTELAGYARYRRNWKKWILEPSFRAHYYSSMGEVSPEPRLGIKYNHSNRFRLKFATGLFSQNILSANSNIDVVDLFYGFLSGTKNLQEEFDGKKVTSFLQKSRHLIFGFEWDLTQKIDFNVEGYIKDNPQLTSINPNKIYDDTYANASRDDYFKKDFIIEKGKAYGMDVQVKYEHKSLYLWFVYSLGWVTRDDGVYEYYPHFDRRHNVNLVGTYKFGKHLSYELSARWNLGSGFPFFKTQGLYEKLPFTDGIDTDISTANGELGILFAPINEKGRLPFYHRLDLTIEKTLFVSINSQAQISFGITNMYDRQNIFYVDRINSTAVYQLPFMPSLGFNFSF